MGKININQNQLFSSAGALDSRFIVDSIDKIENISNAYVGLEVYVVNSENNIVGKYKIKKINNLTKKPLPANEGGYELIRDPKDLLYSDGTPFLNNNGYVNSDTKLIEISDKIDKLPTGIYYGQYSSEENLPDVSELDQKGYAYVASSDPTVYYIYLNNGGGAWEDSGNKFVTTELESDLETKSQTKAPTTKAVADGIDAINLISEHEFSNSQKETARENIDAQEDIIKMQDKQPIISALNNRDAVIVEDTGNVNSLGYLVLSSQSTFATQVNNKSNTIYEIRDRFDLGGSTVSIPDGCTLKFNGGILANGTIRGSRTSIESNYKCFESITFSGNFINNFKAIWIGAKPSDTSFDNSFVIQQWFNSYSTVFKTLEFDYGSYTFKTPVTLNTDKRALKILGNNSVFSTVIPDDGDNGQFFITLQGTLQSNSSGGERFSLENIRFANNNNTLSKTRCIMLNRTQRFSIKDVYMSYYDVAIWIRNCFYGGFYGNVSLIYNRVGIYADSSDITEDKPWHEVNGIDFHNINITGCSITSAKNLWPQNENESDTDYNMRVATCGIDFHAECNGSKFYGNTFETLSYGIRFSYKPYTSTEQLTDDVVTIDSCYFEDISTYSIYSGRGYINNPNSLGYTFKFIHNIVISNCRFASNSAIYLKYGNTHFLNNQTASITLAGDSAGNTYLVYNGNPTVTMGSYCAAHKVDTYFQTSLYKNSYRQLNALLKSRGIFTTASLDLSRSDTNYNIKDPILIEESSLGISPTFRIGDIIWPCSIEKYNEDYLSRVSIKSGNSERLFIVDNVRETLNINGTRLRTFISDWSSPKPTVKTYPSVEGLWPFAVTSDPTTGLVKKVSDNTVVGFGKKAIDDGTYPKPSTNTSGTYYYIFVEGLTRICCRVFNRSRYYVYYNDVVECGRKYTEVRPTPESGTTDTTLREATKVFGTTSELSQVQKRINAIYYDTDEHKTKIFNGIAWIELTDPWKRYYYNDISTSLANRPEMAEYNGQEFYNKATGIRYTFNIAADKLSHSWMSSIGNVDSLEHPNGYHASNNPLTYATELTAGECVICNGKLYSWNGSAWLDANGEPAVLQVSDTSILIGAAADSTKTVLVYYGGNTAPTITVLNSDDSVNTWLTVAYTLYAPTFVANTYYSAANTKVAKKPNNWETNYMDYFTDAAATIHVAGIPKNEVVFTAAANTTSAPRGAKVLVTLGDELKIINVVQSY